MDFRTQVESVLDKIRPAVQMDGGDIELVDVDEEEKSVKIKMVGHCIGCPSSQMTLTYGIEQALREEIPDFGYLIPISPWD